MPKKRLRLIVSVFIVIAILIFIFVPGLFKLRRLLIKRNNLADQIRTLQASQLYLEAEKNRLENDPIYIEKMSRQKLGLTRPGEIVYRIVPQESE